MAAPYLTDWNPSAKAAMHTELVAEIGENGKITVHANDGTKLLEWDLGTVAGTVNDTTGVLTLTPEEAAVLGLADDDASYATLRKSDDTPLRSWPCQHGSTAALGYFVMNNLTVATGQTVTMLAHVIR